MPVPLIARILSEGPSSVPFVYQLPKVAAYMGLFYLARMYFAGAQNQSERNMHSKVILMTGGTSGIGAEVARELATRGAQIIFLTQYPLTDPFLVDFIQDMRNSTGNQLLTAEQVDLADLHSIRKFATKWVDNAPPRRLDMIILCGNTTSSKRTSFGSKEVVEATEDGLEVVWGVNYVANFHLLSILSPALRAQPSGRDMRVIFGTCSSYLGGKLPDFEVIEKEKKAGNKSKSKTSNKSSHLQSKNLYGTSKLALMTFAHAFEKHLSNYKRPDGQPTTTRVLMVDPGFTRTPGMTRFLTGGSLWGLLLYLIFYPLFWMILKSPNQGAQTFLYAAMEQRFERQEGMAMLKECREVSIPRSEVTDEGVQKGLWKATEETIEALEKEGARRRAVEKAKMKENPQDDSKSGTSAGGGHGANPKAETQASGAGPKARRGKGRST